MGTRNKQTVISKDGVVRVNNFGFYDGYPAGIGIDTLRYLKTGNLKKYHENLIKLPLLTDEIIRKRHESACRSMDDFIDDFDILYPYNKTGSDIHKMIENGEIDYPLFDDSDDIEGHYTVDFCNNVFISNYQDEAITTYSLDSLPTEEEYLLAMRVEEDYEDDES